MSTPAWRDCDRCNYDLHFCPGCGENLPHGIDVCDVCREAGHTLTSPLNIALAQRDEARRERDVLRKERNKARGALRAQLERCAASACASPRPLTADDITDGMVKRARVAWLGANVNLTPDGFIREILAAALTEPPARPEWEEEGAKALTVAVWGMEIPSEAGEAGDKLAFSLARHGYKVVPVSAEEER